MLGPSNVIGGPFTADMFERRVGEDRSTEGGEGKRSRENGSSSCATRGPGHEDFALGTPVLSDAGPRVEFAVGTPILPHAEATRDFALGTPECSGYATRGPGHEDFALATRVVSHAEARVRLCPGDPSPDAVGASSPEVESPFAIPKGRAFAERTPTLGGDLRTSVVDRYLHLMQEILINAIYQDRAIDPWSPPVFDDRKRDGGLDWPHQALTMIGRTRLRSLRECCELVLREQVPGDFVETGIWRGGSCIMMAAVLAAYGCRDRTVWGFDSFAGLPPPNEERYPQDHGDQLYRFPQLAVSLEEVTENFRRVGLWSNQIKLVKGWFKDTVPDAPIERIAVLRLDGDLYESTIQVLECALFEALAGRLLHHR